MNRIKELRKRKGLTLDDMSELTGINRATLNRYENGKSEPKLNTWVDLANYFGVSVGYLQGFDGAEMYKYIVFNKNTKAVQKTGNDLQGLLSTYHGKAYQIMQVVPLDTREEW